jgi:hypothetical protein
MTESDIIALANKIKVMRLEKNIERIEKELEENYLKKADLWKGIAIGLVWVAIGILVVGLVGVIL